MTGCDGASLKIATPYIHPGFSSSNTVTPSNGAQSPRTMPSSFGEHVSKRSVAHNDFSVPPCYISPRSADVILSDVRPTKLSTDALNSINALLDELLHAILSAARTLTTTQLRASLNKVLPTTLGKEAVLEAELELRAYWERTGGIPGSGSSLVVVEDSAFNLQWTFEVGVASLLCVFPTCVSGLSNAHRIHNVAAPAPQV